MHSDRKARNTQFSIVRNLNCKNAQIIFDVGKGDNLQTLLWLHAPPAQCPLIMLCLRRTYVHVHTHKINTCHRTCTLDYYPAFNFTFSSPSCIPMPTTDHQCTAVNIIIQGKTVLWPSKLVSSDNQNPWQYQACVEAP